MSTLGRYISVGLLLVLATSVFLFGISFVYAQPAYTMNYQGKLTDNTGLAVADGTYAIEFKIYTQSSGGAAIWTELRTGANEVTVTNGLFSVMLGSVTSISGVNFNQPLYLGVKVEADAEMTPRKALGTVPSAFEAKQLGGVASTSFLRSDAADSATGLLTFTGGYVSSASSTATRFNFTNATGTSLFLGGDRITEFAGTNLAVTGNALGLSSTYLGQTSITTLGTITAGTWTAGVIGDAYVNDAINVTGGTLGTNTIAAGAAWSTAGTLTIGDGGDRVDISSDSWDVTNGVITNVTSINGLVITANTGVITTGTWNGTDVDISDYTNLAVSATGLTLSGDSIALTGGYNIPLTASTTAWNGFYNTPSTRITAGDGLTWSSNTLNFDGGDAPAGELGGTWVSPTIDDSLAVTSWNLTTPTLTTSGTFFGDVIDDFTGFGIALSSGDLGLLTTGAADGECLVYESTGPTIDWVTCAGGATSLLGLSDVPDAYVDQAVFFSSGGQTFFDADFKFSSSTNRLTVGTATFGTTGFTFATAATSTIVNNNAYAFTIATSSTASPLFRIDTTSGAAAVSIGTAGGDVFIGDVGSPSDLIFEESSTISGQGTNTITLGVTGDIFNVASGVKFGIATTTPWQELSVNGDISLTGRIYDSLASAGTNGMVFQTTGSATRWVATSTLGFSSSFSNSSQLAALLSDETGTGVAVFSTSPVLTTPNLGTPSAVTLTNGTGLPIGGLTGLGTGVGTALAVNVGTAGAFVVNGGALGTPSSGTVTNLTGTASININGTVGATTPAAGTFTTSVANSFVPNLSTIPSNGLYLPAANTLGWGINSAAEMQLTSTALSPAADGGNSLGTTALGWQNLFGNTGFVLNIENSDWVATHSAGVLTVGTGDLRVTTAGTNAASVVTVGGTQTLTNKTLTSPALSNATLSGLTNTFSSLTASRALFLGSASQATTTALSASLLNSLTDETGTGVAVFGTAPTFTTNITAPIVIGGTAVGSSLSLQSTSGAGTTDFIRFLVGNAGATEAGRFTTAGRFGIGTTTPNQKLSIFANGADAAVELSTISGANEKWTFGIDDSDGAKFKISSSSALGTNDRFVIDGSGRIGVGTASPQSLIDVNLGAGYSTRINDGSIQFGVPADATWNATIGFQNYGGADSFFIKTYNKTVMTANNDGGPVSLWTNNARRFTVDINGNVGIGTTTPNQALSLFRSAADSAIEFSSLTGSPYKWTAGIDYSDAGKFKISSSSALGTNDRFVIDGSGRVGIGDTTPTALLTVGSGDLFTINTSGVISSSNNLTPNAILSTGQTDEYCLSYELTGTTFEWKDCSGGGMSIGGAVTSGTTGSVLFVDGGNLAQDNANFFFNNTTNRLGLGTTTPNEVLTVQGNINLSAANGAIYFDDALFLYGSTTNDSVVFGQFAGTGLLAGGTQNVAIGYNALNDTDTGDDNVAVGAYALNTNLTGTGNVALGSTALITAENSNYNIGIGYGAGDSIWRLAHNNIMIGYMAGENVSDGSNNIIIGHDIDNINATASNRLNIGNLIFGTALDGTGTTVSSGNIGIGTTSPNQRLSIFKNGADAAIEFSTISGANEKWTIGIDDSDGAKFKISSSSALGTSDSLVINNTGQVLVQDGIVGAPAFSFLNNTNAGLYRSASNQISLAISGLQQVRFSNGTTEFPNSQVIANYAGSSLSAPAVAVGATNTGMARLSSSLVLVASGGQALTILESNLNVGIGDATPSQILDIDGTNAQLLIEESTTEFFRSGVGETAGTSIIGWDDSDSLRLGVYDSPTDTTISDLMTILSTGSVGIGTSTPNAKLDVKGTSSDSNTPVMFIRGSSNSDAQLGFGVNTSYSWIQGHNTKPLRINELGNDTILNLAGGSVGIGTSTPSTKLDVYNGNISISGTGSFGSALTDKGQMYRSATLGLVIAGAGSSRDLYFTNKIGTGVMEVPTGTGNVIFNAGNVGIGTTTPQRSLHVVGNGITSERFGATPQLLLRGGANWATGKDWKMNVDGTTGYFSLTYDNVMGTSNNNAFTVSTTGNIGIGTTTPGYKLSVVGSGGANDYTGQFVSALNSTALSLQNTGTGGLTWSAASVGNVSGRQGNFEIGRPGVSIPFAINSSGNVGIGTTSPARKLHIEGTGGGNIRIQRNDSTQGNGTLEFTGSDGVVDAGIYYNDTISQALTFATNGSSNTRMTIDSVGNVGIGITAPALQSGGTGLHIGATSNSELKFTNSTTGATATDGTALVTSSLDFTVNNREAGSLAFGTSNATRLTINSSGNVGIGTTSPATTLSVAGSGYFTNGLGVGLVNTSAGTLQTSGNATVGGLLTVNTGGTGPVITANFNNTDTGANTSESRITFSQGGGYYQGISGAFNNSAPYMAFSVNTTSNTWAEKMRLTSAGYLGIGDISPDTKLDVEGDIAGAAVAAFFNDGNNANRTGLLIQAGLDDHTAAGPSTLLSFYDGDGTTVGSVTFGSSVTAYNTTSDERLKTNIVDTAVGLDQLMQVKVRDFNWKADADKSTLTSGFIAQELAMIYPQAVTIPRNTSDLWMVDYSKLMPLVIAGVQDQNVTVTEQGTTLGSLGEQLLETIKSVADLEAAVSSGLSENYRTEDETIEAGELVALATSSDATIRRARSGDDIFGVVSQNAGIILGEGLSDSKPIALTGRVKVKVNDEGGVIQIGDAITISSEAGIGTKATTTGKVIGTALEESDDSTDTIHIYVEPRTHFAWNEDTALASLFQPIENNNNDTLWGRITTLASNFVDGVLSVTGIKTDELCVGDVCVDEGTFLKMVQDAGGSGQSSNNNGNNNGGGEVTPEPEPSPEPDPTPVSEPGPELGPIAPEEPALQPEPDPVEEAPTEPTS